MKLEEVEDTTTSYNDLIGNISIQLTLPYKSPPEIIDDYFQSLGIDLIKYEPFKITINSGKSFCGGNNGLIDNIYVDIIAKDKSLVYIDIEEIPVKIFKRFDTLKNFISIIDDFAINLYTDKSYQYGDYREIETEEKEW